MLQQLQHTAILLLFAFLAGLMWLFPKSQALDEREVFLELWWSAVDTPIRVNFLDSLRIESLPLQNATKGAFRFRRKRNWPITTKDELSSLPGIDSSWIKYGAFDFSYVTKPPTHKHKTFIPRPALPTTKNSSPPPKVDINAADSIALLTIPGVGPWGARAIIRERERWGSIETLEQLKDKFPFDRNWDSSWAQSMNIVRRPPPWSLNGSSFDSLLKVPAFNYHQVKKIAFYRESFDSIHWSEIQQWGWWTKEEIDFFKLYITE